MGLETYEVPTSEKIIKGTLVENKYITGYKTEKEAGETHVAEEAVSTIAKYRGGNFFGYQIKSKAAAEFALYDNSEKAEGTIIGGPIWFKEKETRTMSLGYPIKFKTGLFLKIVSGEVESGEIWADVE